MSNKAWMTIGLVLAIAIAAIIIGKSMLNPGASTPGAPTQPATAGIGNAPAARQTDQGVVVATGTSAISSTGQVVTTAGQPVKLDVTPGSPEAPQQSAPLEGKKDIPAKAIKLSVSAAGYSPKEFTVDSGEPVILAVTSEDDQTHIFKFKDKSLEAVALGLAPRETRMIPFNAPKSGTYEFFCDVPGHTARGEAGKMVVK